MSPDMASTDCTYRPLIKPIAPTINLANVEAQKSSKNCQRCAAIVPDRRRSSNNTAKISYELVDLYPDFPELQTSARRGCELCKFIRKTIRAKWGTRPMEEWGVGALNETDRLWHELLESPWDRKVRIHKLSFLLANARNDSAISLDNSAGQECQSSMVVSFSLEFGPSTVPSTSNGTTPYGDISQVLELKAFDSLDLDLANIHLRRRLPSYSTLSKANLDLVSHWISLCKSSHNNCQPGKTSWIPSRLLDVGPPDGSEDPCLIETAQEDVQERYAALSHMWGDSTQHPPLRTMVSTYEKMKLGIPMWRLSKNFADAVIVTRQLGLRYIWIDSLCILQDSLLDWQKEATMMHKVYKYAEVTIVATSATSAHDGFLDRDLSAIPAVKVDYSLDVEHSTAKYFILSTLDDAGSGTWMGDVESCLWNRRGWTCQERKLSTRILHLCKNKLYFECRTCLKSEENEPLEDSRRFQLWPRNFGPTETLDDSQSANVDLSGESRMYKLWTRTVVDYTQRRLTKDTDKLPAIQSIAAEMSTAINDKYLISAGLWKGNLKQDLLWQVNDGPISTPSTYRAPTWSWASLDARIIWREGIFRPQASHYSISRALFEVLDIMESETRGAEQTMLKVRAFLKPLAFVTECEYEDRWVFGTRGVLPYDLFTASSSPPSPGSFSSLSLQDRQLATEREQFTKFAEGHLDLDDKDGLSTSQRALFYLHVNSTCRPSGLIIEPVNYTEDTWRRVGVASVFSMHGDLFSEHCFLDSEESVEVNII